MPRTPWRGWERGIAVGVGLLAALALLRIVAHDAWILLAWANCLTPWVYLPAWVALPVAARRRRVALTLAALAVVVAHVAWVAPDVVDTTGVADPDAPRLRLLVANVLNVHADPSRLESELLGQGADVMVLIEVSPRWAARIDSPPMRARYPHREVVVREDATGVAVLSRRPFVDVAVRALGPAPRIDATLDVGGAPVALVAVHPRSPVTTPRFEAWRAQHATLARIAAARRGPLVIAGDLNATNHSRALRDLERAGMRDVHRALGRGLVTTWPNGAQRAPPLHLDHVLVSAPLIPIRVVEGRGVGSNHRPVIADLALDLRGDRARARGVVPR